MSEIELGNEEVIKRNYEYLILAKENGFFQNGWDSSDIASCDDWVVVWWIDELGDKKQDKNKFLNEILPTFKRWFSNGINSTGVGLYYDFLKLSETNGFKINGWFFDLVASSYLLKDGNSLISVDELNENSNFSDILKHFERQEMLDSFKRWEKAGVPLVGEAAEFYDDFKVLEKEAEYVNKDMFIFFYTLKNRYNSTWNLKDIWEAKKDLEKEYDIRIVTGDEFEKLSNWNSGYNFKVVDDIQKRIDKTKKHLARSKDLKSYEEKLNKYKNKEVIISYAIMDEDGELKKYHIRGNFVECYDNSITISCINVKTKEDKTITIADDDNTFVAEINTIDGMTLYRDIRINDRINVRKNKLRIEKIKNSDLVTKYIEKFGSIKGLAYLSSKASSFINNINPELYPINNLFALCYEVIGGFNEINLRTVLYAYDTIKNDKDGIFKSDNYGYPIEDVLLEETQEKVVRYCNYIRSTIQEDWLPPLPSSPTEPVVQLKENGSENKKYSELYADAIKPEVDILDNRRSK